MAFLGNHSIWTPKYGRIWLHFSSFDRNWPRIRNLVQLLFYDTPIGFYRLVKSDQKWPKTRFLVDSDGFLSFLARLHQPIKSDKSVIEQKLYQIPNPWSIAIKLQKMEAYLSIFRGSNWVISKKSHFPYKLIKRKGVVKRWAYQSLPRGLGPWNFVFVEVFAWAFGKKCRLVVLWSYHRP